ncbi:MAG: hypothetical protein II247_01810 [Lachnospiraceae bacterium]|nr:hypothetical protein [Lachnospiraceae bacterium]
MDVNIKMDRQNRAKQFAPFAALKGYEDALAESETGGEKAQEENFMGNSSQIPVPVIASFNSNGDVVPLYFSTEGFRIKVEKVQWKEAGKEWGSRFRCEVIVDDVMEEVDLYFYRNRNVWTLRRK